MEAMRRDIFGAMKARKAAVQYGHPSKGVQLIVVAGDGAATTSKMLAELLREAGKRVAVFTSRESAVESVPYTLSFEQSSGSIQQALSAARKQRCETVVMEMVGALTKRQIVSTLHLDMALITGQTDNSEVLLDQALVYAVLPHGFSTENLPVAPHQLISVGESDQAEAQISDIKLYRKGTELTLTIDHQTVIAVATHLVGKANATSAAFAAAAGYVLGVPVDIIPEGIARLEGLAGNYQTIEHDGQYQVVVDSSVEPEAVAQLIASAKQLARRRLMVVCDNSVDSEVIRDIKPDVDRLIGVSGHSQVFTDEASSLEEAVSIALRAAKKDDLVMMIGRDFASVARDGVTRAQEIVEGVRDE